MKIDKRCCVCGSEEDLILFLNARIKTKGNDVVFPKAYLCKICTRRK